MLSVLASLVLVSTILYIRKPDSFRNPQFWAEDGVVFFQQAYDLGLRAHLTPYSGYFHEIPRLVASFADLAPYRFAPAIYNYSALIALFVVVLYLHSPKISLKWPLVYSVFAVMVPHRQGEVFLNLTNIQWTLALLLFLISVKDPANTWLGRISDWTIILLAGLSGPFIVILVPVFALQWHRFKRKTSLVSLGIALLSSGIQGLAFRKQPVVMPPNENYSSVAWLDLIGQKLFGNLVLGEKVPYTLSAKLLCLVGAVIITMLVVRLVSLSSHRLFALGALYFGVAVTALAFYKFREAANLLVPPAAATRYFYIPYVLTCWASLTLLFQSKRIFDKGAVVVLLCLILRSALISGFTSSPMQDLAWAQHAAQIGRQETVVIPIHPRGWRIELRTRSLEDGPE